MLSGLLRRAACDASFVPSNGSRYQCASHVNGGACDVSLSVPRERVEQAVLDCVETWLTDSALLAEIENRYREPTFDPAPRLAALDGEIRNLTDAIAKVGCSDALAERLRSAERDRIALAKVKPMSRPAPPPAAVAQRGAELRARLAAGGQIARGAVQELLDGPV